MAHRVCEPCGRLLTQNAVSGVCACAPLLCTLAPVPVRHGSEVEIIQWFVKVGDKIQAFDRVCEVQSDKATVEISSRYDGEVVKVYTEVGGIANVGQPLIDLRKPADAAAPCATPPAKAEPSAPGSPLHTWRRMQLGLQGRLINVCVGSVST